MDPRLILYQPSRSATGTTRNEVVRIPTSRAVHQLVPPGGPANADRPRRTPRARPQLTCNQLSRDALNATNSKYAKSSPSLHLGLSSTRTGTHASRSRGRQAQPSATYRCTSATPGACKTAVRRNQKSTPPQSSEQLNKAHKAPKFTRFPRTAPTCGGPAAGGSPSFGRL